MSSKRKAGRAEGDTLSPDEYPRKTQALNDRRRHSRRGEDLDVNDIERLANLRISRVKLPITEDVSENIWGIGDKEYEFNVPFSELAAFRRTAWGVRLDAESIHVYLRFWLDNQKQCASLCVHYLPSTRNPEDRHKHIPSDTQADFICQGESNFLTVALIPRLHSLIQGDWIEEEGFDAIREVASADPTATCIICGKRSRCKVYRPLPCSPSCREKFSAIPLATRLSPFLRDPPALDLLLCCLASSTYDETELPSNGNYGIFRPNPSFQTNLPSTYPVAKEELHKVLDSFPPISGETTLSKLLEPREHRSEREALLSWLSYQFDGTLVTAPDSAVIPEVPGEPKQFLLLNTNLKRQAAFKKELAKAHMATGSSAFHGTPNQNVFRILQEGLVASQHLREVFYSDVSYVSTTYAIGRADTRRQALRVWKNSAWKNSLVLFGVEVALDNIRFVDDEHHSPQKRVMVRYLFLLPFDWALKWYNSLESCNKPREGKCQGQMVLQDMRRTYSQIKSGDLVDEIEKDSDRNSLQLASD